jgi:hypothetical protein
MNRRHGTRRSEGSDVNDEAKSEPRAEENPPTEETEEVMDAYDAFIIGFIATSLLWGTWLAGWVRRNRHRNRLFAFLERVRSCLAYEGDPCPPRKRS